MWTETSSSSFMDTKTTADQVCEYRASQKIRQFIEMINSRYICGICNLQFVTRYDLNKHMVYHVGMYMCDCCKLTCGTWLSFRDHWSTHCSMVFCPYCYMMHSNYLMLMLHWKMHEPFVCDLCCYNYTSFRTLLELWQHFFSYHRCIPSDLGMPIQQFRPVIMDKEEKE